MEAISDIFTNTVFIKHTKIRIASALKVLVDIEMIVRIFWGGLKSQDPYQNWSLQCPPYFPLFLFNANFPYIWFPKDTAD